MSVIHISLNRQDPGQEAGDAREEALLLDLLENPQTAPKFPLRRREVVGDLRLRCEGRYTVRAACEEVRAMDERRAITTLLLP